MKKCGSSPPALTYSVRPVTMADIPCILGSDTECMSQIIYEWKPHRKIGNTLLRGFWELIVSVNPAGGSRDPIRSQLWEGCRSGDHFN